MVKEPATPESADPIGVPNAEVDSTLRGYFLEHNRPPAFQGSDGHPYTVAVEVEKTPNLLAPYSAYLVFPRWAESGVGIVGHLETPTLFELSNHEDAKDAMGSLTLLEVQGLLEEAIRRPITESNNA